MLILFIKIVNDSTLQFNVESLKLVGGGHLLYILLYLEKEIWLHYELINSWRVLFRGWDESTSFTKIERTKNVMIPKFFLKLRHAACIYGISCILIEILRRKMLQNAECVFLEEENSLFWQWSGRGQLRTYSSWLTLYIRLSVNIYV